MTALLTPVGQLILLAFGCARGQSPARAPAAGTASAAAVPSAQVCGRSAPGDPRPNLVFILAGACFWVAALVP